MSYWPKMARDYAGKKVRLRNDISSRGGSLFKAGHIMIIRRKLGNLDLQCLPDCKIKHNPKDIGDQHGHHGINKVSKYSVEFV